MRWLLFIVWLMTALPMAAQDSVFAFINRPGASRLQPRLVQDYKFEVAERVFNQLIRARGSSRLPAPTFIMNTGRRYMAWMHASKRQIGLEEQAYDICASLGKDSLNALAAMLAHEIIHYYEQHHWKRHFIGQSSAEALSSPKEASITGREYERQADYFGGILALSAGYNTYPTLSRLLRSAYQKYGLPEAIAGYPSLSERLAMSENTAERLRELHYVFQTANLLTLVEGYAAAADYYQHILSAYQGYELYNNAGVSAILAALQRTSQEKMPYLLPVELDLNSRLAELATRSPDEAADQRAQLLAQAKQWLQNAILLDENQPSAQLNLAVLHTLDNAWLDATYRAQKTIQLALASEDAKTAANAQIILGTVAALQGDTALARTYFKRARPGNESLALVNLAVIQGGSATVPARQLPARGVEQIEGLLLEDFLMNPSVAATVDLSDGIYCGYKPEGQSEILLHYAQEGASHALFHQTAENYEGQTSAGVSLGDPRSSILEAYGPPGRSLNLTGGECLAYDKQQLLFLLDETGRLERWIVFRKQLPANY